MSIVFDTQTMPAFSGAGVTSYTASVTVNSGSNRFLAVGINTSNWTAGNPTAMSVTFNSVAMTQLRINVPVFTTANNWRHHCFYMVAPDVGTFNLTVTTTGGSGRIGFTAASYFNVDQASPIVTNSFVNTTNTGNTMTIPLTTAVDAWWMITGGNVDANWTAGGNTTSLRQADGSRGWADSGALITPQTGNAQLSHTGTRGFGGIAFAVRPAASARKGAILSYF